MGGDFMNKIVPVFHFHYHHHYLPFFHLNLKYMIKKESLIYLLHTACISYLLVLYCYECSKNHILPMKAERERKYKVGKSEIIAKSNATGLWNSLEFGVPQQPTARRPLYHHCDQNLVILSRQRFHEFRHEDEKSRHEII
jgi:hypothetical protein